MPLGDPRVRAAEDRADSPLRVLLADDEKPARRRLLELLEGEAYVQVAGACGGGRETVRALEDAARAGQPVDVLFLDVQMPEVDGFAVIDAATASLGAAAMPAVVFVTAYDRYALQAFDAHAVDYLLKPYSDDRFRAALGRAARYAHGGGAAAVRRLEALLADLRGRPREEGTAFRSPPEASRYLDRVVLKSHGRVRFLRVEEIAWIEADGVYVRLHTAERTAHLHRALLGELEAALDPRHFVRIHRSTVVNLDFVDELQADSHGEYAVLLRDRTALKLSRSYRPALEARLGQRL